MRLLFVMLACLIALPVWADAPVRIGFRQPVFRGPAGVAAGELLRIQGVASDRLEALRAQSLTLDGEKFIESASVLRQIRPLLGAGRIVWQGATREPWVRTRELAGERLVKVARKALRRALGNDYQGVELAPVSPPEDLQIESGQRQLVPVLGPVSRVRSRMAVNVVVKVDGKVRNRVTVWFKVAAYRQVLVTQRAYARHGVPGQGGVELRRMDVAKLSGRPVAGLAALAGQRLKRAVRAGQVVTRELLEPRPLVASRDRVKVQLDSEAVHILTWGTAQQDGAKGDVIHVKVSRAVEDCLARVVAKGVVKVVN